MECGLSLGTNMGDRLAHLREARRRIGALEGVTEKAASPVYETEPVDVEERYREAVFLNAVLVVDYDGEPAALSRALHGVEAALGRVRTADRNAPRAIDIDLLYADAVACDEPGLRLPHPRWQARRFVVQPLADVRPGLVLPGDPRPVGEILAALPAKPEVGLYASEWGGADGEQ